MSLYRVLGPCRYREHDVGETFEADLEPDAEQRAVRIGTIEVLHRRPSGIRPGSYRLPSRNESALEEPRSGALTLKGSP